MMGWLWGEVLVDVVVVEEGEVGVWGLFCFVFWFGGFFVNKKERLSTFLKYEIHLHLGKEAVTNTYK